MERHSIIAASVALMTIDITQSCNLLPFNPVKSVWSLAKEPRHILKFCQCTNVSSLMVSNQAFKILIGINSDIQRDYKGFMVSNILYF